MFFEKKDWLVYLPYNTTNAVFKCYQIQLRQCDAVFIHQLHVLNGL